MENSDDKLKRFLDLFWLRPENGLLCTFKSDCFEDIKFESPSLDISCGDGLFMFIHNGGILDEDFDYFQITNADQFVHSSFVDIYDYYDDKYKIRIKQQPKASIDYGIDWKQTLLNKAEKLNLYKILKVHDNNIIPLPFDADYFQTIYSNSLYWIRDVEKLVSDTYRILKKDGVAVFEVATPYFYEYLDYLEKYLSPKAIAILDRNRRSTSPSTKTYEQWLKIFQDAGFKIEDTRNVYPNKTVVNLWNIGLRPISHLIIQMSKSLDQRERNVIKREWVEIFYELFKPLLRLKQDYKFEESPYILFKLRK